MLKYLDYGGKLDQRIKKGHSQERPSAVEKSLPNHKEKKFESVLTAWNSILPLSGGARKRVLENPFCVQLGVTKRQLSRKAASCHKRNDQGWETSKGQASLLFFTEKSPSFRSPLPFSPRLSGGCISGEKEL